MFKILSTLQKRDASQTSATNRKLLFPLHTFTSIPLSPVNSKFSCFLFRKIQAVPTVFCIRYRMFHATLGFCERCSGSTFLETSLVGTDAQALVCVWRTSGAGEGSWDWAKGEEIPAQEAFFWPSGVGMGVQEESECRGWKGLFKSRYGCRSYSQRRPEPFPSCLCSGWWRTCFARSPNPRAGREKASKTMQLAIKGSLLLTRVRAPDARPTQWYGVREPWAEAFTQIYKVCISG